MVEHTVIDMTEESTLTFAEIVARIQSSRDPNETLRLSQVLLKAANARAEEIRRERAAASATQFQAPARKTA